MNPVLSLVRDRNLAQLLAELAGGVVHVAGGGDGANHLHQFHQRHRIEKVQADEALRALGRGQKLGDRDRGGIGREDGVFLHDAVERCVHLFLLVDVFDDGLDDDVAVGQVLHVSRAFEPRAHSSAGASLSGPFSANLASDFSMPAKPLSRNFCSTSSTVTSNPASGRDLRNTRTHQPATQNANFFDFHFSP